MLLARNRNYRLMFTAAGTTNLADGIAALAFPWLATLITRDPVLIGAVAAAGRLPWMLLSLPIGVITDRADRLRLMQRADAARAVIMVALVALIANLPSLPLPQGTGQEGTLIAFLCLAAFCLGTAEVLRDNAAQTAMPSVVEDADLERANGQIWSIEKVMNQFVGPPLAGLLIALAVPAPFVANLLAFGLACWLLSCITARPPERAKLAGNFAAQLKEGFVWIWENPVFLRLGIMLGITNFMFMMSATMLVLLSREIYGLNAAQHGLLLAAGAVGAVIGGSLAPKIVSRFGSQKTLLFGLALFPLPLAILALTSSPIIAGLALALEMFSGMVWNIVTVSLRQRHIPAAILGRVNAIYRFLGWGPIPLGALFAGLLVTWGEAGGLERDIALRLPYLMGACACPLLLLYAALKVRLP